MVNVANVLAHGRSHGVGTAGQRDGEREDANAFDESGPENGGRTPHPGSVSSGP